MLLKFCSCFVFRIAIASAFACMLVSCAVSFIINGAMLSSMSCCVVLPPPTPPNDVSTYSIVDYILDKVVPSINISSALTV